MRGCTDERANTRRQRGCRGDPRGGVCRTCRRSPRAAGRPPGLGIVLVGDDPASEVYVRNKVEAGTRVRAVGRSAAAAGDRDARRTARAGRAPERAATRTTASWCSRRCPRRWGSERRSGVRRDRPGKDVDGFHPVNVGRLVQGRAALVPCTPSGVIEMLDRSGIAIAGRARGRHRAQRDRRQADGDAAAAARRDGDDLPLEDAGPGRGRARRPTSWSRRSAGRGSSRRSSSSRARR